MIYLFSLVISNKTIAILQRSQRRALTPFVIGPMDFSTTKTLLCVISKLNSLQIFF